MHGSSSLAACPRLRGEVCPSSFRGHVGSLFSPDYSRYWPPWGLPPQPRLMSVQVRPYLHLLQIAAVATGRAGSRWDLRSQP